MVSAYILTKNRVVEPFANPLGHFLALASVHPRTGMFIEPGRYTQTLAAVQYTSRLWFLKWSFDDCQSPVGTYAQVSTHERFLDLRAQHLVLGSPSVMHSVLSWLQKGHSIVENTLNPGDFSWSPDRTILRFNNMSINLRRFPAYAQSILQDATGILEEDLFFHDYPLANHVFPSITDDINNCDSNYYFGNHLSNSKFWFPSARPVLRAARQQSGFFKDERIEQKALERWMRSCERFEQLLLLAFYTLLGLPARGTELLDTRIFNTSGIQRNLVFHDNDRVLATTYNKSMNVTGKLKPIVRMAPPDLRYLYLQYLHHVRPFAKFLAKQNSSCVVRMSPHMWPGIKDRCLTDLIQCQTAAYLGVELNLRQFRQLVIKIDQDIVSSERGAFDTPLVARNPLSYLQAGHTQKTSQTHYGLSNDNFRNVPGAVWGGFKLVSRAWHTLYEIDVASKPRGTNRVSAGKQFGIEIIIPTGDDWRSNYCT